MPASTSQYSTKYLDSNLVDYQEYVKYDDGSIDVFIVNRDVHQNGN